VQGPHRREPVRYRRRLHHIGIGCAYKHQRVTLLVAKRTSACWSTTAASSVPSPSIPAATISPWEPAPVHLNCPRCRETCIHNVLRHDNGWGERIRTSDWLIQNYPSTINLPVCGFVNSNSID
jgi:hypothetical protein